MSSLQTLVFFATPQHACSYLEGKMATTLFVDPRARIDTPLYSQLTALGFRRSGSHFYRPHCEGCNACIAARVPVARFNASRNQKRVWRQNLDLTLQVQPNQYREEYYALYERYITQRHADGDMYPPSRDQFNSFLVEGKVASRYLEMRLNGQLLGLAVIDLLDDGLSAIYTLFSPDHPKRSLGTLAVLWQIQEAQRRNLPHVYLGYWIKQCQKMRYKGNFQPLEILQDGQWIDAPQ